LNQVLHDGIYVGVASAAQRVLLITALLQMLWQSKSSIRTEFVLYTKTGMGDGQQANNLVTRVSRSYYKSFLG
jgi:molybdopterin-containing oxidoreductase family iron-sulfur binding subunit